MLGEERLCRVRRACWRDRVDGYPKAVVYGEEEPADYFYKVVSGVVRAHKLVIDGRRLVGAFHLPGDIFGLDRHLFTDAVVDAEILVVSRDAVMSLAERDDDVARDLWALTAGELQRAQSRMLLLNRRAPERVASFLLEMAERIESNNEVHLAMSRQDVADIWASRAKPSHACDAIGERVCDRSDQLQVNRVARPA